MSVAAISRRARSTATSACSRVVSGITHANSSPPTRPRTSSARAFSARQRATAREHLVAGLVAAEIVDLLEVIDVDHRDRQRPPWRSDRATSAASRSYSVRRLASPVSASVAACAGELGALVDARDRGREQVAELLQLLLVGFGQPHRAAAVTASAPQLRPSTLTGETMLAV